MMETRFPKPKRKLAPGEETDKNPKPPLQDITNQGSGAKESKNRPVKRVAKPSTRVAGSSKSHSTSEPAAPPQGRKAHARTDKENQNTHISSALRFSRSQLAEAEANLVDLTRAALVSWTHELRRCAAQPDEEDITQEIRSYVDELKSKIQSWDRGEQPGPPSPLLRELSPPPEPRPPLVRRRAVDKTSIFGQVCPALCAFLQPADFITCRKVCRGWNKRLLQCQRVTARMMDWLEQSHSLSVFHSRELKYAVRDYLSEQKEVTMPMRAILVDWLIDVNSEFDNVEDTLFLAVMFVDRVLSVRQIRRRDLQLLGATAMLLASKLEEVAPPNATVDQLISLCNNIYPRSLLVSMESAVLEDLGFGLQSPTVLTFVRYFLHRWNIPERIAMFCLYIAELSLASYEMTQIQPSLIATAIVCAALYTHSQSYDNVLVDSKFHPSRLCSPVRLLYALMQYREREAHLFDNVFRKYAELERHEVSKIVLKEGFILSLGAYGDEFPKLEEEGTSYGSSSSNSSNSSNSSSSSSSSSNSSSSSSSNRSSSRSNNSSGSSINSSASGSSSSNNSSSSSSSSNSSSSSSNVCSNSDSSRRSSSSFSGGYSGSNNSSDSLVDSSCSGSSNRSNWCCGGCRCDGGGGCFTSNSGNSGSLGPNSSSVDSNDVNSDNASSAIEGEGGTCSLESSLQPAPAPDIKESSTKNNEDSRSTRQVISQANNQVASSQASQVSSQNNQVSQMSSHPVSSQGGSQGSSQRGRAAKGRRLPAMIRRVHSTEGSESKEESAESNPVGVAGESSEPLLLERTISAPVTRRRTEPPRVRPRSQARPVGARRRDSDDGEGEEGEPRTSGDELATEERMSDDE